jgi:acyl-CoA dehydrogenase
VAVPYLKLFGIVAGGWVMARAAVIAHDKLSDAKSDARFLSAKIITARFYAEHILPGARGFADTVLTGSSSVLALDEGQF